MKELSSHYPELSKHHEQDLNLHSAWVQMKEAAVQLW